MISKTCNNLVRTYYTASTNRLLTNIKKHMESRPKALSAEKEYLKVFQEKDFEFSSHENSIRLMLRKKIDGNDIEIGFTPEHEEFDEALQMGDGKYSDTFDFVKFILTVSKDDKVQIFKGYIMDSEFDLQEAYILSIAERMSIDIEHDTTVDKGPVILELKSPLKEIYFQYLRQFGIEEELLAAMEKAIVERQRYLENKWCKNIIKFLS